MNMMKVVCKFAITNGIALIPTALIVRLVYFHVSRERESTSSTAAGSHGCTSRKTRRPQMLIQIAARGASATDSD